jgi:cyclic pyranopterin phosphate synthase
VKKGDPLQAARLAGILAAKRTADLIPLCHQIPLSHVDVEIRVRPGGCVIRGRAATVGKTGVEMEAMVAVVVAALTMYDMLKAVDRSIVIGPARLLEKRGGRSGHYRRP